MSGAEDRAEGEETPGTDLGAARRAPVAAAESEASRFLPSFLPLFARLPSVVVMGGPYLRPAARPWALALAAALALFLLALPCLCDTSSTALRGNSVLTEILRGETVTENACKGGPSLQTRARP